MSRQKATVTLDRGKANVAKALIRAKSLSETIDVALEQLIRSESLRRDIAAYKGEPPTEHELALANLPVKFELDDDDVDYDAIYKTRR